MLSFKSFLTEGVSPILYHATDLLKTLSILEHNKFYLSTDLGTESDRKHKGKKLKPFFLSTSRIAYGGYLRSFGDDPYAPLVNIVLDGVKLSHNLSGLSVDYYGRFFRPDTADTERKLINFENEDRLYSDKGTIEKADKYIKEIHIMLGRHDIQYLNDRDTKLNDQDQDRVWSNSKNISKIIDLAQIHNIEVFVYSDFKAFQNLNKKKARIEEFKQNPYNNRIDNLNQLFEKNEISELSEGANKERYNVVYHSYDLHNSYSAELHNVGKGTDLTKKKSLDILVRHMQKNKLRNIKDVIQFLQDKWKDKKEDRG